MASYDFFVTMGFEDQENTPKENLKIAFFMDMLMILWEFQED